jgi:hypothetical protein
MSTDYRAGDKIRMQELFDGRLTPFGVVEELVPSNTSERARVLTDGQNFVWVYADDGGYVSGFSRYAWNVPRRILEAVAEVFDTEIFSEHEPQFWGFATEEEWDAAMEKMSREDRDKFHADILRYLAGAEHGIGGPGTVGMTMAEIARELVSRNPELVCPEKKDELMAAINAEYTRKHDVIVQLDEKDDALVKMLATDSEDLPQA